MHKEVLVPSMLCPAHHDHGDWTGHSLTVHNESDDETRHSGPAHHEPYD